MARPKSHSRSILLVILSTTIEEIRAGIREKSVERSEAVKKIWAEIERKRKEKKRIKM